MKCLNRWMAILLALCMVVNTVPFNALAESNTEEQQKIAETSAADHESVGNDNAFSGDLDSPDYEESDTDSSVEEESVSEKLPESDQAQEPSESSESKEQEVLVDQKPAVAAANAISHVGDTFADAFIDVLNDNNVSATITKDAEGIITLTIGDNGGGKALELLSKQSQTADNNYQNWKIYFSISGSLNLTADFDGLGDDDFPFMGNFAGESITLNSSKTIFKALGANADLNNVKINWTGTNDKPILTKKLVADSEPHEIKMPVYRSTSFSPYIEQLTGGTGLVTLPSLDYSGAVDSADQKLYQGDAGLVCCKMEKDTRLKVGTLSLNGVVYLRADGSVGGLVGNMKENTELIISQNLTLNTRLTGADAGGLIGSMTSGTISFEENCSIKNSTELTASSGSAGGIAGVVITDTGLFGTNANVSLNSVKAEGASNTGVYYGNCTVTGEFNPLTGVTYGDNAAAEVSGSKYCGGIFGTLTLNEDGKCILNGTDTNSLTISSTLKTAANTTRYGGIAGKVCTADDGAGRNALVVAYCQVTSNIGVGNDTAKYPKYIGGIVAEQEKVTVDVKNTTTSIEDPKTALAADFGFGGVTAYAGDHALLIADSVKVSTSSYINNQGGGGVAGSAHKGSIVYLKTSLDLSECPLTTNATSGQIVGQQDCSLIYAPGVAINRYIALGGMELDDIGNYGEMYRIDGFLSVNQNYSVDFHKIGKTGDEYQLSSSLDYAAFALAWQSRGYFSTVTDITTSNWAELKTCKIKLNADIDMGGSGIGGLTRDVYDENDTFSGSFDGNGKKITLDIGAVNGGNTTGVNKGDGRIYKHNATGLFAVLSSGADVQNLTLAGSIRISNNQNAASDNMVSGGLAAHLSCAAANAGPISNVSTEVSFNIYANGDRILYAGGLFGRVSGSNNTTLTLNAGQKSHITVSSTGSSIGNGSYNHIGGVIGAVDKNSNLTIECVNDSGTNGAVLEGKIEYTKSINNIYAGGLIGTIFPGGSGKRTIKIHQLEVNGFELSGTASDRMGGILGGIWADTDVQIDGLTVVNSTLSANGTSSLGGLVYRASGKWTVSSADLGGLTISAGSAAALGLMVCQGGPYKDTINGSFSNVDGLYLEMAEHWEWNDGTKKGYQVPSGITFGSGVFDEFVAYTACAGRSSNIPDYQITENGCGIISLKTDNDTVNMTDGVRNTYKNRTTVGQTKQTNLYSRYYYNLPKIKTDCNGGNIDTAKELLIWSVYRYASSNLRSYFAIENVTGGNIGGSSAQNRASFDMEGLSYYPINITNEDVTLQYADVKFYNDKIEEKENGNKLTRGDAESHSQHYTMHCGLFMNFYADLTNAAAPEDYAEKILTVNGVTFAGFVGAVNGGSGALICGTVKGAAKEGNTAVRRVILADADDDSKAVSLNGISVAPEGDYTPVLINTFGSYAGLRANYVIAAQTGRAGSSLIGNVGGQNATNVTIEFAGTIRLPETGIFTRATLLNSLRYENGSATYRFYKDKDYNGNTYVHNATHGQELSTTVEYAGKQGCYYDGYGLGYFVSKNGNFNEQNNFSGDLPYVALSPANQDSAHLLSDGWHELAVNVRSYNLLEGCGTYGHPYKVDANLLKEAANYINTGNASNGWQVRIASDGVYHTDENNHDTILIFNGNVWQDTEGTDYTGEISVQQYLANAYYEIQGQIELSDFSGIGTDGSGQGLPFTGVIKGENASASVTLSGGSRAFIKYSYGSVVRDLTIVLDQSPSISWESQQNSTEARAAEQAPKTFFGGVIGCVLGGDNIIENVTVQKGNNFNITVAENKSYLVPLGGYVGVIAGGGVIFRGSCSNDTGITGTAHQLYRSPVIGRVLGGYAFYEGNETVPDNGDKNYKINKLSNENISDFSWDGSKLTVNSAQGLLILSAIVSSGAGSKESNAYTRGKVRNAAYDHIGENTEPSDYTTAKKDAGKVWEESNTPYLLNRYAGYVGTVGICDSGTNGIVINFAQNNSFDMQGYGNGYRGLSARYVSNAAFAGTNGVDASAVVMRISSFDGQNADVGNISMNVKEYADDDFHAASLGGIFNIVWTKKQSGGVADSVFAQNLTLTNCNVSLQYINDNGDVQKQADTSTFSDADGLSCVAVGGFIGSVSDIISSNPNMDKNISNYLFSNLHIKGEKGKNCRIAGYNSAGGLIGASAMTNSSVKSYPGVLLSNSENTMFGPSFRNCSYECVEVTAKLAAGGLIGYVFAGNGTAVPQFTSLGISSNNNRSGCYASCTVTDNDFITGNDSTICAEARRGVAGGIFGGVGMRVLVNAPDVNTKTGLSVTDNNIFSVRFKSVNVNASVKNEYILRGNDTKNGPTPNGRDDDAAAAGIIGRIGSVNPTYFYDICLESCLISTGKWSNSREISNYEYAGGIVGYGYTNTSITMQRCNIVKSSKIDSKNSGGFLGYGYVASGFILHMSDCKLEDSTVYGDTYSGGLVGKAAGKYFLFNILIKNTSIDGSNKGRLFGWMNINANSNDFQVYAAGISIYADKEDVTIPAADGNTTSGRNYIGYIAYADYAGTEDAVSDDNEKFPYVTANPNFRLDGVNELLTGDAVGKIEEDTYGSVAARIWADQKTGANEKKNLVSYSNAAEIVNAEGKAEPVVSTFNAEQGCGPELPVLVLNSSDAGVIEDYLNVITNGGYSKFEDYKDNSNYQISLTAKVYYYDKDKNEFTLQTAEQSAAEPPSINLLDNKTPRITKNAYDNTRNRFTLIEAGFTVTVNNQKRTYKVSVPVIVKRELHYNFMSTFSYGTEFMADTFKDLRTHVLENAGNPITAYLTYQYNCEETESVEYDWQGYMNDGGDMLGIDKILSFSDVFPEGTRFLLLDCQDGNRAYSYKIESASTGTKTEIKLSDFSSVTNPNQKFQSSMADILNVAVSEDPNGKFIKTDISEATLRRNNQYYRLIRDGETISEGTVRYSLTVPEDLEQNIPNENYYLVINVPSEITKDINGSLDSKLDWDMPSKGTWVHRYSRLKGNVGNNDESTYQISTGYRQTLESTAASGSVINLASENEKMKVRVKDTITFSNKQVYGDNDQLFMKLTVDLQEHLENSSEVTDIQFPAGTTGRVRFYIQDTEGQYYLRDSTSWLMRPDKIEAAEYDWISQGANMELLLSKDGKTALDLSGVRKLIKGDKNVDDSQIIITAEMDIDFNSQEILNMTVPGSERNGTDKWVQLHYTGRISTRESSLAYSVVRATADDNTKYYRAVTYKAVLSMDAASISQLGINPLELVPEYVTSFNGKKASRIDLIAALDLSNLPDIKSVLENTNSITFTLSLKRKNINLYGSVSKESDYVEFDLSAYSSIKYNLKGWSWTIPKDEFYKDGKIVTDGIFDGTQFLMPLTAYVFTDQKGYANYKIELNVDFDNSYVSETDVIKEDAYVIYTFACVKPEFYVPPSLSGQ